MYDPFFNDMPAFFNMSFKELLASKHPSTWIEFECGHITEDELAAKFFADGRAFDGPALRRMMVRQRREGRHVKRGRRGGGACRRVRVWCGCGNTQPGLLISA